MSYYSEKNVVREPDKNKIIAIASHKEGAEIIARALNYLFSETFSKNEAVEMMHRNTSKALKDIAYFLEKHEYTGEMAIDYLREISEVLSAQADVVSIRDELKLDKPNER